MKPGTYDGRQSLDSFLAQFEVCASYNRWTNHDKAAFLKCALVGGPAQILWDSGDPRALSYDQLLERLRQRYGSTGQAEKFRTELRARRRKCGEALTELHADISRLMALAYPMSLDSAVRDIIARDCFIAALGDRDFELKLREREPVDLDEALRMAIRLEAYASAYEVSIPGPSQRPRRDYDRNDDRMDRRVAQVERALREIKDENTDDRREDTELRRKYDQLTKDYDKLKLLEEQRLANAGTKPPNVRDSNTIERRQGPLRCYGCRESGHFKSQCPNKVSARSSERNPRQNADALDGDTGTKTVRCTSANVSGEGARRAYLRLRI